jgi:hypothetical protein
LGLKLPVQSVPITTKVVRSNLAQGEVYLIQHYVIKFVSEVWQVGGTPVSSTIKTDRHNIHDTEIFLKVVLNTITPSQTRHPSDFNLWRQWGHRSIVTESVMIEQQ